MKKLRKPLLLLLVLAFVCQGLIANALPCQMPLDIEAPAGVVDMPAMDHSAHRMPAAASAAADGASNENCCDAGLCTMSHCQSTVTLPLDHLVSSPEFAPVFSRRHTAAAPLRVSDSLYRPPISR